MGKKENARRLAQIVECAEDHFGQEVLKATAPGGEGRSSFRLHMPDRTVIATLRPNFRRTHLEAHVLRNLSAHCDDVPECLGVVGEIMFQSDVGDRRLNVEIAKVNRGTRLDLAAEAVAAIFRFQSAARKTDLHKIMPHLGANRDWIDNFVDAADALEPYGGGLGTEFDRDATKSFLTRKGEQFVKWDCRSGNAAIGADGRLRWFDFEYSGLRHGAEDFAWLIGDEAWPIAPDQMVDVMIDAYDPDCGHELEDYLMYLAVYTTFHCVQRFKLIVKEAQKRGWLSKTRVRKYDDAGVHPEFAAQVCEVGRYFSAQHPLTVPLTRSFEGARDMFRTMLGDAAARKSA